MPGHLVNGSINDLAQLLNFYTKSTIGVMILIGNIPLLILGWRHLGGRRFAVRTTIIITTNPDQESHSILTGMERGVTVFKSIGVYT